MISNMTQRRTSIALPISPLAIVVAILGGLLLIEGLLLARFWIQLTALSTGTGMASTILEVTQPLVAPFADARAGLETSVGTFERSTLFAAFVYLVAAVGLVAVTMAVGSALEGMHRFAPKQAPRGVIASQYSPLASSRSSQLQTTAFISLSPHQTARALRMLHLDRFDAELVIIPAQGGCIVAAFTDGRPSSPWPLLGRITHTRQQAVLSRTLHALEERFMPVARPKETFIPARPVAAARS